MKQNKIFRLMLTLVLALCAWTTASADDYTLTVGTATNVAATDGVLFKVNNATVTSAAAGAEVTIVVTPQDGYLSSVENIKATASMGTGNMQARTRASLIKDITVTQAVDGQSQPIANTYIITMPAADVTVDVVCGEEITETGGAFTVSLASTSLTYTGSAIKPAVTVKKGDNPLTQNTDYTVTYSNNKNVGTATATVKGIGAYSGTVTKTFTINRANVSYTAPKAKTGLVYTGQPQALITAGSATGGTMQYSLNGSTYSTTVPTGTEAKEYTVYYRVVGDANHNSVAATNFKVTISLKTMDASMIAEIAEQTYTGGPLTPAVVITNGEETLVEGTDYTVEYTNNTDPGEATVTITGIGNYSGSTSMTFTIVSTVTPDTDTEASITIGATGKSTFVSNRDVDFTGSTAEAYIAVGYNATEKLLTLGRIYRVPAGTPVMVKGAQGALSVPFTSGATYEYLNLFEGNTTGKTVEIGETSGDKDNYVMSGGEFQPVVTNAYIPTGKAYLQLPGTFPATNAGSAVTVTLTASGKSTLCSSVDLDFSNVEGMKAYVATGYDRVTKVVMLSRVLKASAGTPLVLHGKSNASYTIPSAGVQTVHVNMLVGNNSSNDIRVEATSGSMVNYYLSSGEFKAVVDYVTVPGGKCYLQLPNPAAVRSGVRGEANDFRYEMNDEIIVMRLDGSEATGIQGLLKAAVEQQDVYYNLNGQRTENPRKGIYVQKGRKIVVK